MSGWASPTQSSRTFPTLVLHPSGRWQRAPDDAGVDAALAPPRDSRRCIGHRSPVGRHPRSRTVDTRRRRLLVPLPPRRPTPRRRGEGAFLICGFWMSLACLDRGRPVEAARWFERNRARAADQGSTPKSSTSASDNSEATSPRPSCTRRCSSAQRAKPTPHRRLRNDTSTDRLDIGRCAVRGRAPRRQVRRADVLSHRGDALHRLPARARVGKRATREAEGCARGVCES